MLVFWTPRLTSWVLSQARVFETKPVWPKGVRLWEEWSLISRDPVDPSVVGMLGDLAVWAEIEGAPSASAKDGAEYYKDPQHRLAALRAGALVEPRDAISARKAMNWASQESFAALTGLCNGFLNWSRLSLRGMKARPILEWQDFSSWALFESAHPVHVVPGSDGPLVQVVERARLACERLMGVPDDKSGNYKNE
jgi:hypothetical protein